MFITSMNCRSILDKLLFYLHLDNSHIKEIIKSSSIALLLKIVAAGLSFTFNVLMARLLGARDTGILLLAITIVTIAAVLGRIGLDNSLIKFISSNAAVDDWKSVKGAFHKGVKLAFIASFIVTIVLWITAPIVASSLMSDQDFTGPLRIMILAVIPLSLFNIYGFLLQGLKKIKEAVSVLGIFLPLFNIVSIYFFIPVFGLKGAAISYFLSSIMTLLISIILWHRATGHFSDVQGNFSSSELLQSSIPLYVVAILQLVIQWSGIIFIGIFRTSHEVAFFGMASRTALLISFILLAVNTISAPKFAELYKIRDMSNLQYTARKSVRLMMLIAGPLFLAFILIPHHVMSIFGPDFKDASILLIILSIGNFFSVSMGSVGYLLMMCGHENLMRNTLIICASINFTLNLILIPLYGALGAALASMATLILQNVIAERYLFKIMGISTIRIGATR